MPAYNAKTIVIVNRSTCLPDAKIASYIVAVQKQITEHFGPIWGYFANLKLIKEHELKYYKGAWTLYFQDYPPKNEPGLEGVLGYHDVFQGVPVGYVFAKTDLDYKLDPCVTFSHEILEMLADSMTTYCALVGDTLYSIEVADAVEDDEDAYIIEGQRVSNFVYPEWFDPRCTGKQVDHRALLRKPLELRPGGYIPVFTIGKDTEWRNLEGGKARRLHIKQDTRPGFTRMARRNAHNNDPTDPTIR